MEGFYVFLCGLWTSDHRLPPDFLFETNTTDSISCTANLVKLRL